MMVSSSLASVLFQGGYIRNYIGFRVKLLKRGYIGDYKVKHYSYILGFGSCLLGLRVWDLGFGV